MAAGSSSGGGREASGCGCGVCIDVDGVGPMGGGGGRVSSAQAVEASASTPALNWGWSLDSLAGEDGASGAGALADGGGIGDLEPHPPDAVSWPKGAWRLVLQWSGREQGGGERGRGGGGVWGGLQGSGLTLAGARGAL